MAFLRGNGAERSHPADAPGFSAAPNPFTSISKDRMFEDDDGIDFEDTYDGLGDQLNEDDDDLNDDTFGGPETSRRAPGKDFDFYGSTNQVSDVINEEAVRFNRQNPTQVKPLMSSTLPVSQPRSQPFKTGYEAYKRPGYVADLQVDPSLWGNPVSQDDESARNTQAPQQKVANAAPSRKMMSLEEVEASMQTKKSAPIPAGPKQSQPFSTIPQGQAYLQSAQMPMDRPFQFHEHANSQPYPSAGIPQISQQNAAHLDSQGQQRQRQSESERSELPADVGRREAQNNNIGQTDTQSTRPHQILQNSSRTPTNLVQAGHTHIDAPDPSRPVTMPVITHPSQLANLSEAQRQMFMEEEAKRAKRNHKIYMLSRGNGLMTPQDKNFITRIQLQQLMTATSNISDQDPDATLAEDFYYQVYNQIENRPRQNPHQPLSNFAQTYLFQTGGRAGAMNRRHNRGDNHVMRMQQQVQRAVEAAKAKPKNQQLVIEGSLGKISFSNAKTPKPLLNIKRNANRDAQGRSPIPRLSNSILSPTDRKAVLQDIENVYASLMRIEDHDRRMPPQPANDQDSSMAEAYSVWRQTFKELNQKLWTDLKVLEPINPESATLHPFIAILSYPKGKKAIPRVFTHIEQEQRLTILTIIMIQMDTLDVVRFAQPQFAASQSVSVAREQVDLFMQTVMPSLFSNVTEAALSVIIGVVGLIIDRVNIAAIIRSRVGLEILTMLLSQAEIIHKNQQISEPEWRQWTPIYSRLFDTVEPYLPDIFPNAVSAGQDVYVWQFLATMGTGASPDQQQRLVIAVKDRVMETVRHSKTLPAEMASEQRGNVNLFMQAIGLDVNLLE